MGIQDTFGPEAEFFIFDDVRYQNDSNQAFYAVDSEEGIWNSGNSGRDEEPNLGYKPRHKEGYFPTSPTDSLQDIRSEMLLTMEEVGIEMECHHHEVATAGQCEIDMRFAPLVKCADNLMWYKYIVKNVAKRHGKTATFMPKPLFGDNGTGMHVHQSIWKGGKPLFAGDGYSGFSEMGLHYIGGILKHARGQFVLLQDPLPIHIKDWFQVSRRPSTLLIQVAIEVLPFEFPMYSQSPKSKTNGSPFS